MRLVCPNCEAKYEVPDDAIPDTGRDVQCTNCNHTWFQMRGRSGGAMPLTNAEVKAAEPEIESPATEAAALAEAGAVEAGNVAAVATAGVAMVEPEPAAVAEETSEPPLAEQVGIEAAVAEAVAATPFAVTDEPPTEVVPEMPVQVAVETASEAFPAEEAEQDADEAAEAAAMADAPATEVPAALAGQTDLDAQNGPGDAVTPEAEPAAAAYAVDDSVLAILREEAEREANARRAEALESQTELGIDAAVPGKSAAKPVEVEAKPAARRDLLPDVEEINSTLRPSEAAVGNDGTPDFVAPPPQAPHGFRSGFLTLMTVAILAAALYIVAPRLITIVPALSGPLETYVSLVDGLRLGLDGMMRSATVAISGG